MTEHGWEPDPELLQNLTEQAANRLRGNPNAAPVDIIRSVIRKGVPRDVREEYFSAVASALSERSRLNRPPVAAGRREPLLKAPQPDPQLGFGFGEGPRVKIRPPTRRHL